jgi:hypothetical protein
VALFFSLWWYVVPKGPWKAVGAFGPTLFICDFAIGHRAWGVTSQFPIFVSHRSNAFLRVIRLMGLATQLTAVLYAGSRVSGHNFLNLRLCFKLTAKSESELLYDWRLTANQFILAPSPSSSRPELFFFATEPLRS